MRRGKRGTRPAARVRAAHVLLPAALAIALGGYAVVSRVDSVAPESVPAQSVVATPASPPQAAAAARHAHFGNHTAPADVRHIADWALDSGDHRGAPFMVIDKVNAQAYAFDREGELLGAAPVLLGIAKGDDTAPGVGDKPLAQVGLSERTTAAGRFVAELGWNLRGEDVLWVDYDAGLSLHRVLTTNRAERRAQRLASATPQDNRISYGCINVPVAFFEKVVRTAFTGTRGIVYILPETRSAREVFGSYDVDQRAADVASRPAPETRIAETRARR